MGMLFRSIVIIFVFISFCAWAEVRSFHTEKIEQITGIKGTWYPEVEVFKISIPRTDITLTIDQWKFPPYMGFAPWISFQKIPDGILAMGDFPLFQDEVNPVMSVALDEGLLVTALHNHFFYDNPRVFFMHIEAQGSVEKVSQAIAKMFDVVKKIRTKHPQVATSFGGMHIPEKSTLSPMEIENIFHLQTDSKDGMVKVSQEKKIHMGKEIVGMPMGANSAAAFAGTSENAVVDGDIAVFENQLQDVLKTFRTNDIYVIAIHNHMINENPRLLFVHFWGKGPVSSLAKTIKHVFDIVQ
jgi:hypothetical protein